MDCGPDEYAATTKGQSVCRSSPLWRLQLFIDDYGVMCVRNRARGYTSINEDLVALSPEHWATKLIVRSYHEKYFHINHETTINEKGSETLGHAHNLPYNASNKHRDRLSTNSCLMGLRRHIARRGTPKEIYSDNGTNFRGTDAFLRENMQLDDSEMHQNLMRRGISWYFNPPAAPHMGGAWERLVRSIKTVLYRIVSNQKFTDESLLTAMMEVEMTVNSRPLTFVSSTTRIKKL
ncbi:hypothetical protein ACLKA6_010061 [Drosophila palustris]